MKHPAILIEYDSSHYGIAVFRVGFDGKVIGMVTSDPTRSLSNRFAAYDADQNRLGFAQDLYDVARLYY